jgi:hypothetical protein
MQPLKSFFRSPRDFWANSQNRKTVMWVIAAVGLFMIAYAVLQIVPAQLDYMDLSDELEQKKDQIDAYVAQFPTSEVDGVIKPDLTNATQADLLFLATMKREERETFNRRVDAINERALGVRIAGIGIVGLALAYLVAPEGKRPQAASVPPGPDEPPFDVSG